MPLILPKHGDGFLLRELRPEDAASFADIEYDPEVKMFVGGPPKRDRADWVRLFSPIDIDGCAVEALPERVFAGHAAISRTATPGQGEVRIVIGKKFWGRSLGRKAVALLIPAAFEEMGVISLLATIHPENRASLTLFKSFGFTYLGKKEGDATHWQYGHRIYELTRTAYNFPLQRTSQMERC